MKFTGAVLVFTVIPFLGITISTKLKRRCELLEKTLLFLDSMKLELKYSSVPFDEMIRKLHGEDVFCRLPLLEECYIGLENGADFPLAWKNAVSLCTLYTASEKEKLMQLGDMLGTCDSDGQMTILEIYLRYFEAYHARSKEKCCKYSGSVIYLSIFISAALLVVLI